MLETDDFIRLFRISGMGHCTTGPGAWMIEQSRNENTRFRAESNGLAAVVEWVEGTAPEMIEKTKFVNDTVVLGVERKRRHCRYPFRNTYLGSDSNLPESWQCMLIGS